MSDRDSFIEEVSEEVRRDRLYGYLRRYGWIGILAILLVVGGAAWREWRSVQDTQAAQALGDAVIAAFAREDPASRIAALQDIAPRGAGQAAYLDLLRSAQMQAAGDEAGALALLDDIGTRRDVPQLYRTLAGFRALLLRASEMPPREVAAALDAYASPGQPFRALALEQQALALIAAGERAAALAILRALPEDPQATPGLRRRAGQLMVALGEDPPADLLPR